MEPSGYVRDLHSSDVESADYIEGLVGESVKHMHMRIDRITFVVITSG
jgi:hypothetical protein